jgi:hypothetical protein
MLKSIVAILFNFLYFASALAHEVTPISILEASQQKLISVKVQGKGGYQGKSLKVEIKNLTTKRLTINLSAGTIFDNTEDWQQDLMVVEEQVVALNPKTNDFFDPQTVCIQPSNGSPKLGVSFLLAKMAEGHLLRLAQLISEKKYFNSTAQSAVWAVINGNGLSDIYGENPEMVKELCAFVSAATGKSCETSNYTPRQHQITSIRTSMDVLLTDYTKNATLTLYTRNGQIFRTHLKNIAVSPGFHRFKMGVNHTLADTATFYLRLEENGKILYEKIVSKNDSVQDLQKMKESTLTYNTDNEITARIGIYDEKDNLYILLADNKDLKKGFHKSAFLEAKTELPMNKTYYFKVKADGKTVAQQKIFLDREEAKKYAPITKRGVFSCKLDKDIPLAQLAVYDTNEQVVWVVFTDSKLYKGNKQFQYVFQHQYGADANFTIKLTDKEGNVISQQQVKGK